MQIRRAAAPDAERIAELLKTIGALHHTLRPDVFGDGAKFDADGVRELMDEMTILVAQDASLVIGYVFCKVREYPAAGIRRPYRCLWVEDLCVDERARGRGVAAALMEAAEGLAREHGCAALELNVWEANEGALAFYEHIGLRTQRRTMEKRL